MKTSTRREEIRCVCMCGWECACSAITCEVRAGGVRNASGGRGWRRPPGVQEERQKAAAEAGAARGTALRTGRCGGRRCFGGVLTLLWRPHACRPFTADRAARCVPVGGPPGPQHEQPGALQRWPGVRRCMVADRCPQCRYPQRHDSGRHAQLAWAVLSMQHRSVPRRQQPRTSDRKGCDARCSRCWRAAAAAGRHTEQAGVLKRKRSC